MCVILHRLKGSKVSKEHLLKAKDYNPDGYGIMYVENGKVIHKKGFIKDDKLIELVESLGDKEFVLHFRIKTHGKINEKNCHPFHVGKGTFMMHNGQLFIKTPNPDKSDTYHFADYLEKHRFDINNKKHLTAIENNQCKHKTFKNRIIFMSPNKVERLGDWSMLEGNYWSNLRWKEEKHINLASYGYSNSLFREWSYYDDDDSENYGYQKCCQCKTYKSFNQLTWYTPKSGYICKTDCGDIPFENNSVKKTYVSCKRCQQIVSKSEIVDGKCDDCNRINNKTESNCLSCGKASLDLFDGICTTCEDSYMNKIYKKCENCGFNKKSKEINSEGFCKGCLSDQANLDDTVVISEEEIQELEDKYVDCPSCYGYLPEDNYNCSYCDNKKKVIACDACNGEGQNELGDYCSKCDGRSGFPCNGEDDESGNLEEEDDSLKLYNFTIRVPADEYRIDISKIKDQFRRSNIKIEQVHGTTHDKKCRLFRMKFTVLANLALIDSFSGSNKNLDFSFRKLF